MFKLVVKTAHIFVLLSLFYGETNAQTKLFTGTGSWHDASRWSPTGVPTSTDIVLIAAGASITLSSNATCDSVYFQSGSTASTLTISNAIKLTINKGIAFSNPTANVTQLLNVGSGEVECLGLTMPDLTSGRVNKVTVSSGNVKLNGNLSMLGSTSENIIEYTSAGRFRLGGTWTTTGGTFTMGTSTFEYFANSTQAISSRTYNKLILTGGIKNPSGSVTCNDSLIINAGATLNNSGTASLTMNGVFYIAGTYIEGSTSGSVTLVGLVHIATTGTFQVNVAEIFAIRGGIKNEGSFISGSGTYTFATNNQELSGNKMITFSGGVTVTGITLTASDSVRINGSFTGTGTYVNQSYLLLMGATNSISNLDLSSTGNTVEYGAGVNQTVKGTTYKNLRITGSGTKTANADVYISNSLFIDAGPTLALSTFLLLLDPACLTTGTGNLSTANITSTPIPLGKTWPFTTITYNSASAQTIVNGTYNNLSSANYARTLSNIGAIIINGLFTPGSGTYTTTGSVVQFNSVSTQTIVGITGGYNKVLLKGGTKNPSGTVICNDSFIINTGVTLNNSGSANLRFNGVFYIGGTYIEGSTSGTVTLAGLTHIGPTGTFQATVGEAFTISGGIKNEGTFISGGGTYTFATNNQELSGNKMFVFAGSVTATGITLTATDSVQINGSLAGTGTYVNKSYLLLMGTSFAVTNLDLSEQNNIVEYGRASAQTIRAIAYKYLRISGGAIKTAGGAISVQLGLFVDTLSTLNMSTQVLSVEPNCTISGTGNLTTNNLSANPVPSNLVWPFTNFTYGSTSTQTIVAGSYVNLTSSNAARILQNTGIIKISGIFTPGTGTYTRTGSTIEFNGSSSQTIPVFTYNNLISSNTGARTLASGTITIQGNFNPGNNSYTTTGNTMVFNSATQNLSGTFNNLTLSTAGTKTANGNITVAATINIASGVILDLTADYTLLGTLTTITNNGTIKTAVASTNSTTPISNGKTWTGTIEYYGNLLQTAVGGTYTNLILSGNGVKKASGDITVNGTLNLGVNPNANQGILEMTNTYGSYANINNVDNTSIYNNLNSYILTMGSSATTVGNGDVTGKIRRTTFVSATTYTFGNVNTQLTFTGSSLPSQITVVATRGNEGIHVDKNNSVKRLYQVLRTGGNTPTTMNIRLAYSDEDLNGNTENNLVLWDHHLPYGGLTPHEHGKTNQNTSQNWIELTSHGILYLAEENDASFTKYWMISDKISVDTTWLGAVSGGSWNIPSNWNTGAVPPNNAKIIIPDAVNTPFDPTISGTVTVGTMEIKTGGVVNGSNGTLILTGGPAINGGAGTWLNNGTFNAGTGNVVFDNTDATIAGTTTFNNLTINNARKATVQSGSLITINGTLTNNGTFDAASNPNIITYTNTSQNVLNPNGTTPGYSSLVLNGATPILPSTLDISGNLTLNTAVAFTGNTTRFRGTTTQIINGTNAPSFNNLIINSTADVSTVNNITVNGTLNFTSGKLNINNTTLTLTGNIVNTITEGLKSGGEASLIINGNQSRTLSFDQTTPGTSNKLNSFTNNSSSSTTTIANMMLVDDVITPTSGTINANGNITLLSNATKTARIAQGTGNYITGNVKAQRYIPESARRWRFVSSPVNNATLEDWRGEMYITGPGTGTTIGTTNSNGYDATANNAAGVYWYNETLTSGDLNTGWTVPTNTSHILTTGRGYRLFVRGDRSDINRITNANPNQNAVTIDVTGPVNKGDITMPVTFTSSGNLSNDGWNLIGNPYPSPFNWKTFHETGRSGNSGTNYTNIEPTIWVLDPVENTYKFYNTLSNEGTIADGILSQSQGFWVKATGPGASITFKESFKTNDAPTQLFKSTEGGAFRLKLMRDALNADDLLIKYMSGSTTNFDAYDVVKLSSPVLVSAWGNDSVHLALSTRPLTTQNDTIKLYVNGSSGTYTMQFTNSDKIAIQDQVLFFDTYTNNVVDLKQNSNYTFNINTNTAATFGFNRFYIVVANNNQLPVKLLTFTGKKEDNNQVKLSWTTAIERNSSRFEVEHATDNKIFKPVGVVNAKGNSNVLTQYTFTHNSASTINYYRLKQIDVDNSFDYSKVVMINFNESEEIMIEPVKIYPIPAKNQVTVELNKAQNITAISIYKLDGVLVNSIQSNNPKVRLETSDLPQGVYVLQIEDEFGEIFKRKLIKE